MDLIIIIVIFILICLAALLYNTHIKTLSDIKTGGFHISSIRQNPLVFISAFCPPKLSKMGGWNLIKSGSDSINKKISDSILKKPTIVVGSRLREDIIYEKPDLHIHLTPIRWDLSNPMELAQKRSEFESRGANFDEYFDDLGRTYLDELIVERSLPKVSSQSLDQIKKYLDDVKRVKAGSFVI